MIVPCIDLMDGKAVQLVQGRRLALEVDDVLGLLERFRRYAWLHVIDLDAALRRGRNEELVRELCTRAPMRVRVGGGIRTVRRAEALVEMGADQIVVGSAAFKGGHVNTLFLSALKKGLRRKRVIVALDTIGGRIAIRGWRERLDLEPAQVMEELEPFCAGFLCTDVDREGTMGGANLAWFRSLRRATKLPIIAAGGIKSKREVAALERLGMDSAIGMALYAGRLHRLPAT